MNENKFTWVETHKELTLFLSTKENSQKELIDILKSAGISPFNDKAKLGDHDVELDEIDPFTFFCYIYKYGPERRLKYLQEIAENLKISIPNDDLGIPSANAQRVWLFPYKYERVNNEIKRLWNFFNKAINNKINDEDFADALLIRNVAKAKITEALFNINPEKYFPINGPTKPYLKNVLGIEPAFETYAEYIALLENIKSKITIPFYSLSYEAWKWNDERNKANYWIFQGNPKIYNVVGSLNDNMLTTWSVKAHEDKIKVGDKIILWVTGKDQGCYALGEITSDVYEGLDEEDQTKYYTEQSKNEISKRVKIKITNNLSNNPISKDEIENISELKELKVGNQGTNFSATEDEYETLLELAKNQKFKKYWLYAPGENAEMWHEFYELGIMGLGWDELGDLNNYSTKADLTTKLQDLEKTKGSKKNDSTANYEFKDIVSIGDVIITKKGRGELLGYGIVSSAYYYDKERLRYQKCRKVEWKKKGNWKTDHSLALKTLTDITKYPSEHPDYEKYYDKLLGIMNNNKVFKNYKEEYTLWLNKTNQNDGSAKSSYLRAIEILSTIVKYNIFEKDDINKIDFLYEDLIKEQRIEGGKYYNEAAPSYGNKGFYSASIKTYSDFLKDYFSKNKTMPTLNFSAPLNKILYGPPGTGKTYNTLLLAAQIIKRTNDLNYDTAKVVFNENLGDKIEFITFHQNYSYEDFIQGLRPDVEVKGNLSFERKDGVFARIAINALFEYFKIYSNRKRKLKTTDQNLDVNEVYLSFFNFLKSNPNQIFKTKTGSDLIIKSYSERKCLRFSHSDSSVIHTVSGDRLIKLYEKFPAIEQIKNVHKDITVVLGGCNATVYWTALNEFIKYYKTIKSQRKDIAEEDLINYEDISFEEKKEFLNTIELSELYKINSEEVPNYVIIIDEINRANISRVFGELITLIEPDKRSHGELPLKCTLPSGEEFIVPSNLYIIGTMNTADKSIALLDIALRRRFEFQAMYPDYEIEGIYDLEILKKINIKIIELKGYDFQIGHSYFMNSKDDKYNLTKRMNKKVIPLLLEYFMNNREEVEKIISHSGLTLKNGSWPLEIID